MADLSSSKRIEDNTIKYELYPSIDVESVDELVNQLSLYVAECLGKLGVFLREYIWQFEPFNLKVVNDLHAPPHIEGVTNFGDNIEDEWFITYLLVELTKFDPKLVVRVEDDDGDFIFIEAAEYLPKRVTPETSVNRVFIFNGFLHFIPLKVEAPASISAAIEYVRQHSSRTKCQDRVQSCLMSRIAGYPEKMAEFHHRAKCFIPAAVATLLNSDPNLISHAVRSFYHRDPIDMRACRIMKYFPPENRVFYSVKFTKCLYAQLMGQNFKPDRKIGWQIPSKNSPNFKPYDLGVKIACGFEILVSSSKRKRSQCGLSDEVNMDEDRRWLRFLSNLKRNGYFRDQGSKLCPEQLEKAKTYFSEFVLEQHKPNADIVSYNEHVGDVILNLMQKVDTDFEALELNECQITADDDDSWLNITPNELDSFLKEKFVQANGSDGDNATQSLPDTLQHFLESESGLDGVEIANRNKPKKNALNKINFDADNFDEALSSILHFQVPHSDTDSSSSSALSDYNSDELDSDDDDDDEHSQCSEFRGTVKSPKKLEEKESENLVNEMKQYMNQMDRELEKTSVGESFERKKTKPPLALAEDMDDEVGEDGDDYKPVDVDLTALKNILQSYSSQHGLPGPASNLLSSMNIVLPDDKD